MPTLKMLEKEKRTQLTDYCQQLLELDAKALEHLENMKKPYIQQKKDVEAFLKNQRTTDQLFAAMENFKKAWRPIDAATPEKTQDQS